jgi:hypothetical protein
MLNFYKILKLQAVPFMLVDQDTHPHHRHRAIAIATQVLQVQATQSVQKQLTLVVCMDAAREKLNTLKIVQNKNLRKF